MNKRSIIFITLLIFVSLAVFTTISFAEDEGRSYSIPFANIHLYIQEDGNLRVVETIHYTFSGTYNGVTRNIPFKSNETIENLTVSTSGAYSKFTSSDENGQKRIKVYLYSNSEMTTPVTNRDVEVTYEYNFINVVKLYNDGATLQYNLWGEEWEVNLGKLNAYIHLNNKTSVKYWLNPSELLLNTQWDNNTLKVSTDELHSGELFELRMIIPKDYFINPIYTLNIDGNGVSDFENLQKEYEDGVNFFELFYTLISFSMIILSFIPIFIYFKYGREPKISYHGIYEHEPPTNDSPVRVNSLYKSNVGSVDMDGFKAAILSLVNKKYLKMDDFETSYDTLKEGETVKNPSIVFNNNLNLFDLPLAEKSAFETLKVFANTKNGKLDLTKFENDMKNENLAKRFRDSYNSWCNEAEEDRDNNIEEIFVSTGYNLSRIIGIFGLIFSGLFLLLMFFGGLPFSFIRTISLLTLSSILLLIVSIILLVLPNYIMGHWTVAGRENNQKWKKFKKYLNDFSLIKEYPPSSIVIWNEYLIYATALGVAKNVQKAMEKLIPKETLDNSDSYLFYSYGGSYFLFSSFDSGISTANSGDAGGNGGFGGGSGGGGGGAF
jgi:uncharacterized membrane protein